MEMDRAFSIGKLLAEIDGLLKTGEDARAEARLVEAVSGYAEANPDDIVGQSVLFNELGGFYRNKGRFDKGEAAYWKAKELLEQSADTNENWIWNYATTLNNLAGLYRMDGQLQKAAELFDRAIEAYEHCQQELAPDYLASAYNNKGLVCLDLREADKAKALFLKAKAVLERTEKNPYAMGTTLSNLGFAAVIEKEFSKAIALFREAEALFRETGDWEMARRCKEFASRLEARR
ncbi:MAG TPA: tetratricopeptide repeat protein [Candidatus Ventrimonas merdavium]|nr:tetratricopeptide repeat protein [Candidatus Ventrimonas merdavium]